MERENYITIQGWMVTDLKLSGNELLAFAIIYGFSQGGNSGFNGGLKYLMEWLGSTKKTVISALSSLVEKGFVTKYEDTINGVKFCRYVANYTSGVKITPGGGVKITPNNKAIDNKDNPFLKESVLKDTKEKDSLTDFDIAFEEFKKMRKAIKAPLTDYGAKRILSTLNSLAKTEEEKVAILNQSIERGWRGVFALKEDAQKSQADQKADEMHERIKRLGERYGLS